VWGCRKGELVIKLDGMCGDGTGFEMLWDVRGECEGDGGTECGDGAFDK
jgi:hypothetical protein